MFELSLPYKESIDFNWHRVIYSGNNLNKIIKPQLVDISFDFVFFLTQNTLYIAMFASLLLFCSNDIDFKLNAGFFLFAVHEELRQFFVKLLRKIRKSVQPDKLDSALSKFCYTYSAQDAWEIERFGYKKSSLSVKVRILKVRKYDFFHICIFFHFYLTLNASSTHEFSLDTD